MPNVLTDTHPYQATVSGELVYINFNGERVGGVPFSLTIADNCCEEHAEGAARAIIEREAVRRTLEERRFSGPSVTVIYQ